MSQLTLFKKYDTAYHIQELRDLCEVFGIDCTDEMIEELLRNLKKKLL